MGKLNTIVTTDSIAVNEEKHGNIQFGITYPKEKSAGNTYAYVVRGWIESPGNPAKIIEVIHEDEVIKTQSIYVPPNNNNDERQIFEISLSVIPLPQTFNLKLSATLNNAEKVFICSLKASHRSLKMKYSPKMIPIILNCIGRTGSTLAMEALSLHPEIVTFHQYPYEITPTLYWLNMFRALSETPSEPLELIQFKKIYSAKSIGANLFNQPPITTYDEVDGWLRRDHVEDLAAFCASSIENVYRKIAEHQGQKPPRFFIEKMRSEFAPAQLIRQFFPRTKEIFLFRDPRDRMCSVSAFKNFKKTAIIRAGSEAEAVVRATKRVNKMYAQWLSRKQHSFLLRYEDLIISPKETLCGIFKYLGINHDDAKVKKIIDKVFAVNSVREGHMTSKDFTSSIGRWRKDLNPEYIKLIEENCGEMMKMLGYL